MKKLFLKLTGKVGGCNLYLGCPDYYHGDEFKFYRNERNGIYYLQRVSNKDALMQWWLYSEEYRDVT